MVVGPFLHLLESNLLRAVDPATPAGKTRYLAQQLGSVPPRAMGGLRLQGGNPGFGGRGKNQSVTER